jgi:predicted ATPase
VRRLPTGTVTFLFTDIEGSTRLLHELGERYADVLAEHRRLLREAFERHDGVEVDTQGDAFFVAFSRATDAVTSAAEAQRALATGPVRVRMGLHTGEPTRTDEGYVGMDVHRAARIAAAGHGGQVLVSQTTRELLDGIELRDLGEHRLKDLAAPQRLYQLGEAEFPPLKSLYQTNLPVVATPFLGREEEVAEVLGLLRDARLVTLTGPGGTGKTRLALQAAAEAAEEFEHGVFWAGLAPLRDPELVLPTVAAAVDARDDLFAQIGDKRLLLLVDNFEHVVEAAPGLGELLASCPNLKLLVTSREPLHLEGEWEYAVQPLRPAEAAELFEQRARAIRADFSRNGEVAEICDRLDGLPLAVELAAARVKVLSPAAILERLEQRLPLLTGGARNVPERQRTLRATIEWSYELLTPEEQQLFARLAVFAGGCTLEAAEDVGGADIDTLQSLVDKSLVRQSDDRFWMLETIREYAAEQFERDPSAALFRRRHAEYFAELLENPRLGDAQRRATLQAEHENARAALDFLEQESAAELEVRLATALAPFWLRRGHTREGHRRMEHALDRGGDVAPELRVRAHSRASDLARLHGDLEGAFDHAARAMDLARDLDDPRALWEALHELGESAVALGDYTQAAGHYEEAIAAAREAGESPLPTLGNLGDLALATGDLERALVLTDEASALARQEGAEIAAAIASFNRASALIQLGRANEARPDLKASLETAVRLEYPEIVAWCLLGTAAIAAVSADANQACLLLGAAEAALGELGLVLGPSERRLREFTLSLLRDGCDGPEIEPLLEAGREQALPEAVALASRYVGDG